jgi:hypothetical protein
MENNEGAGGGNDDYRDQDGINHHSSGEFHRGIVHDISMNFISVCCAFGVYPAPTLF